MAEHAINAVAISCACNGLSEQSRLGPHPPRRHFFVPLTYFRARLRAVCIPHYRYIKSDGPLHHYSGWAISARFVVEDLDERARLVLGKNLKPGNIISVEFDIGLRL